MAAAVRLILGGASYDGGDHRFSDGHNGSTRNSQWFISTGAMLMHGSGIMTRRLPITRKRSGLTPGWLGQRRPLFCAYTNKGEKAKAEADFAEAKKLGYKATEKGEK